MLRRRSEIAAATLMLLCVSSLASAADILPAGGTIDDALGVDMSPKGLGFALDQGVGMIPPKIVIPDTNGTVSCGLDNFAYSAYQGVTSNGIHVNIGTADIIPRDGGFFDLSLTGTINGTGTDTAGPGGSTQSNVVTRLEYDGCLFNCRMPDNFSVIRFTGPMPFSVATKLNLSLTVDNQGNPHLTASTPVTKNDITVDLTKLDGAGCNGIDAFIAVGKYFLGDTVKDQIIKQINETLIPQIEQGFESLKFDQDIALAGTTMHVKLQPSGLTITQNGMLVGMSSAMDATTPTTCVPIAAGAGSAFTSGTFPTFGTTSPGGIAFDAAAGITDDLVNQALFAAWHGGLLCRTVDTLGSQPLDTSILSLAGFSGPLSRLGVEDGTPVLVVIKAYNPPTGTFGGAHLVNVNVQKLEVSIFTTVQERVARIVALDLDATAGVDLSVDADNQLAVALNLDPSAITGAVSYNEPVGEDANAILALLPTLAGQLGPQLAGAIPPINLGNLAGVSLTNPEFLAQQGNGGVPNDTLSLYTGLAAAPGGCTSANPSGCGVGTGTGSGCDVSSRRSANGAAAMLALLLTPFAFVLLRRRS